MHRFSFHFCSCVPVVMKHPIAPAYSCWSPNMQHVRALMDWGMANHRPFLACTALRYASSSSLSFRKRWGTFLVRSPARRKSHFGAWESVSPATEPWTFSIGLRLCLNGLSPSHLGSSDLSLHFNQEHDIPKEDDSVDQLATLLLPFSVPVNEVSEKRFLRDPLRYLLLIDARFSSGLGWRTHSKAYRGEFLRSKHPTDLLARVTEKQNIQSPRQGSVWIPAKLPSHSISTVDILRYHCYISLSLISTVCVKECPQNHP
jgi:hypothetical protein